MQKNLTRFFVLFWFSWMCSSCSKLEFIYDWSDSYIVYELDRYFDLTNAQEKQIKKEVKSTLNAFLLANEPAINQFIDDYKIMIEEKKVQNVERSFQVGRAWWVDFSQRLLPLVLQISSEMNEKQMNYFQKEFEKKLLKEEKRNDDVKGAQKRVQRWMDFIGLSPNQAQREMIQNFAARKTFPAALQREHSQSLLQQYLLIYQNKESREKWIHHFLTDPATLRSQEYSQAFKKYESCCPNK